MEKKTVGIVGAGVSGLAACKHALQRGFRPLVFEAEATIGGLWCRTLRTTKLQTPTYLYQFADFPWPEEVESFPESKHVLEYIQSYARRFDLLRHVRFGSRVVAADYVGTTEEEMDSWALWAGAGEAFGGKGRWHLTVQQSGVGSEIFEVDFLILCIGRFSGRPNIPSFPANHGPEVFQGKVLHSMDYANMDNSGAKELVKGKKTVVVGFSKSAVDIAMECSDDDKGASNYPCTLIYRDTPRWVLPDYYLWSAGSILLYLTPLGELLVHKPGEGLLLAILATLLSPLKWLMCKALEGFLKWKLPLGKYGLVPKQSLDEDVASSSVAILPEGFYRRVEQGRIIPKRSKSSIGFYADGVVVDDRDRVPADIVILATGFKGDEKIRDIFSSPKLQRLVMGSTSISVPLYRDCIHPRIPQLAIIGYCENLYNLHASEIRCIWLMKFLDGRFRLPAVKNMEEDVLRWQEYMKRYGKGRSSIGSLQNWHNAQLCKDMEFDPRRRMGLKGWILPCRPEDYTELLQ